MAKIYLDLFKNKMHQEDDENYYDDEDSLDYSQDPYKHLFKFDEAAWESWGKFLYDALEDISQYSNQWYVYGWDPKKFPVNSYIPSTGKKNNFQYLGTNYDGVKIWKKQYFIIDSIQSMYINHIQTHAIHFLKQPHYYKGLFDILN
jgi:hypothetical protein